MSKSYSATMPEQIDITSSKKYNYYRSNVEELTNEDGETYYQYDEVKVLKNDWQTFIKNKADIEYIAMMTGVEL